MIGNFTRLLEKGLSKFLRYKTLVELSSKLNFPLVSPITAGISITLRCNSKCGYCDIWRIKEYFQISLNDLDKIFNFLKKLGVRIVYLTGGEPLTRGDLEEVVSLAKHYGMFVAVCTNGILLTKERGCKLAEAGINRIILSFDTLDPEVYEKHRGIPFRVAEQALSSLVYTINKYPAIHGSITCVITRYNIGKLVPFVKWIYEYGNGKISVTFQSYHRPPPLTKVQYLTQNTQKLASELITCHQDLSQQDEFIPNHELRPIFENEIQELIQLKKLKPDFPIDNSEFYLENMSDFLFDNRMPKVNCMAGYISIAISHNLEIMPCWRLPPIGDFEKEDLTNFWFTRRYRKERHAMKNLKCPGCMFVCHRELVWYEWYNMIYKSHRIGKQLG